MDRIAHLEERVAHLVRTTDDLSDVIATQAQEIARLERLVRMLIAHEAERADREDERPPANVPPPHW